MNTTPVLAVPISDEEKEGIFDTFLAQHPDEYLERYVSLFLEKNHLQEYKTTRQGRQILLFTAAYSLILVLNLLHVFLYHEMYFVNFLVFAVTTLVFWIVLKRVSLKRWLMEEIKRRPQDPIDNILVSQVSGTTNGKVLKLLTFLLPALVAVGCLLAFFSPRIIYERNNMGGYSIRYYSLALNNKKYVTLPESHNGLPVNEIRGSTFTGLGLYEIELPSKITEIRGNTFENCKKLRRISIPEGVTRIGGSAFRDCTSLREVQLPSTIREIGSSAFRNCVSLREINIPSGANVKSNAFKGTMTHITHD